MSETSTLMAEVIVILGYQLDCDGKRRAAAKLRERATVEASPSSVDFLESIAASLDRYADEEEHAQ